MKFGTVNSQASIVDGGIFSSQGEAVQLLHSGERYTVRMQVKFEQAIQSPVFAFTIKDIKGTEIAGTNTHFSNLDTGDFDPGRCG